MAVEAVTGRQVPPAGSGRWRVLVCCLLFAGVLTPFLFGGVVSGDSHGIMLESQNFAESPLSLGEFLRSPSGSYPWHHIIWFAITYTTLRFLSLFSNAPMIVQAVLSAEGIFAALLGLALCYVFLLRRMRLGATISAATILAVFVGSYGIFAITMGGTVESFVIPVMAIRLFFFEGTITRRRAGLLAITDIVLVAFKPYGLVVIAATWPLIWPRAARDARIVYGAVLGALFAGFALFKLSTWNPTGDYSWVLVASVSGTLLNLLQQIASPWSGLPFCMPVMMVLFWCEAPLRRALMFKLGGLLCCMLILSIFPFFDGDVPGGRYIFPFLLVLLPEIAAGVAVIARKAPRAMWLLPLCVAAFLPTALYSLPFFLKNELPSTGTCLREHPVPYSWKLIAAQVGRRDQVDICYHGEAYTMATRDAASPRTAPWRVAYFLFGAHSAEYLANVHGYSGEQQQHDKWGAALSARLSGIGLGSPAIWRLLGSLPAIAALLLAVLIALRLNRRPAFSGKAGQ